MNSFRLDGVRVLLVDDASAVLDVVSAMLVQHGAEVTAVGTAEAALAILRRDRPTVLVGDLSMPDKGGYWLIGRVRALSREDGGATAATPELVDVVATLAAGRLTRGVDAAASTR
jgi:two-component system CheB/CheR fusion protein